MSRVHRRGVIAAARDVGGAKTYSDFVAHVTALAAGGSLAWSSTATIAAGLFRTTAGSVGSSVMSGSSWMAVFRGATSTIGVARVVQHGLPSEAVFNDQVANAREIFIEITSPTAAGKLSLARNGYTSTADAATGQTRAVTNLLYWDGTQAQQMNPSAGTGPTPYTW